MNSSLNLSLSFRCFLSNRWGALHSRGVILLIVRTNSHCDRPIGALPLHCCAIGIVVETPNFSGNTANELLDDLDAALAPHAR